MLRASKVAPLPHRSEAESQTVVLAFPSSNQNVRADAHALQEAGMLALFCTTIAWRGSCGLFRLLPRSLRAELERRVFEGIDPRRMRSFPSREVVHQVTRRLGFSALTRHETGWASVDGVSRAFDKAVARLIREHRIAAAAIYAYEYAALRSFEAAAEARMRCFYELPIGYWRAGIRILTDERERNPEWASTIELLRDSNEKREHKDAEVARADHIIVPSDFVRDTLREHPGFGATIDVVPYGAPPPRPSALANRSRASRLRVLYVGHLSQRKGMSYLFDAMRRLNGEATLTLIGHRPDVDCPALTEELKRHTWLGTLPHRRVLEIMGEHDLFVFPSLFEGLALVILEAMAQGLPVVATRNSGGGMAIDDGANGFIVPIQDATAIAERIALLAQNRDRLAAMSAAALRRAEQMSWEARATTFIEVIAGRLRSHANSPRMEFHPR